MQLFPKYMMSKLKNTIFKIHQNETKLLILGIFFWKRVKAVNKQKLKKKIILNFTISVQRKTINFS